MMAVSSAQDYITGYSLPNHSLIDHSDVGGGGAQGARAPLRGIQSLT